MHHVAVALLVAVPWLHPYAPPPTPAVAGLLLSGFVAVLLTLRGNRIDAAALRRGWLLAATLSALMGLLQYSGWAQPFGAWIAPANLGEAYANLRQRNHFATLMNIGLVALLSEAATRREFPKPGTAIGPAFLVLLLAAGNVASASRTGLLQLLLIAAFAWFWGSWRQTAVRALAVLSIGGYVLASILLPRLLSEGAAGFGIWMRLQTGDHGCNVRSLLWANVIELIGARPWTGWGWGELDFAHFSTQFVGLRFCDILDNAHNLPLHLAAELGLPVALLICVAGVGVVWRGRPWSEADPERQSAWAIIGLIVLHSLLEYPLWYGPFQLTVCVSIWVLIRSRRASGYDEKRASPRILIAALAFGSLTYVAWDYNRVRQIYLAPNERSERYRGDTLEKLRSTWLFRDQFQFAEYMTTPLTRENAATLYVMGLELLHYSPEPLVVQKLIESAVLLGRIEEARFYQERLRTVYPNAYARWISEQKGR